MKLWSAALLAAALAGCGEKTAGPVAPIKGWRSAGLEAPNQGVGKGQWLGIAAIQNGLIALNTAGEIYASSGYSSNWSKIPWNVSGTPYRLFVDDDTLWVGTEKPGRLYRAVRGAWSWSIEDAEIPEIATVYRAGKIRGHLVAFAIDTNAATVRLKMETGWVTWSEGYPFDTPFRILTVGDTLWSATWESGLWYRVWGESSWKKLPAPWMTDWWDKRDSLHTPRGLAWYDGSLWLGDWLNELSRAPGGHPPYQGYRNCAGGTDNGVGCKEIPLNIYTVLSYRGHLFVSGHFPASGFVWDDSSGFFLPMAEGWCWNDLADCGGLQTRDLVGLGDTLYAAASRFIMKFPLSDLPVFTKENAAAWKWNLDTRWRDSLWALPNPSN